MDLAVEANALGRYTIFPQNESATVPKDRFGLGDLERLAGITSPSTAGCWGTWRR
jgi:hypothetical protein